MTDFTDKDDLRMTTSIIGDYRNLVNELKSDILILVGRLYDEDENTFAPETRAVMNKWKPVFKKKYLKTIR